MGRLTRAEATAHREALGLAGLRRDLDEEEKRFVLAHYQESASQARPVEGTFFTPTDLADCMSLDVVGNRVIDLCAGIGALAFACRNPLEQARGLPAREIVCVESDPEFVAVGMKLVPEATWVCADVFEVGRQRWRLFDTAIANPPFGPRPRTGNAPGYRGPRFEYHVIALASHLARHGVFLVPQTSAPFHYSGSQEMLQGQGDAEYKRFSSGTGIVLEPGCSVDTAFHDPYWHQPAPRTEIVTTEFGDTALARHRRARSRARAGAVVAPWDRATRAS
ncbi:methyltransferase [Nocardia asiatica]|uniref:methyltransferase n=1 Tax=Nocardia asiatica TaxID=209252 RepID=UPI0003134766|nr:methyltransferase [Nocardia asiatica]